MSPAERAPPPWRNANAITSAAPATDARPRPLVGDEEGDQRGGDRQHAQHHAAMRGVDGLDRERHQERKQDAHAEHRDRQLQP